jgi:hypothetical protein
VAFCFYFVEDVLNPAVGADHEGHSGNAFEDFAVHGFVFDYTECVADFFVGVGQESVRKVVFVLELLLFFGGIGGDAEDDGTRFLDLAVCVAEPARFFGSTGSVGLGVEKQHHGLTAKIFQGNRFAILVRRIKVGGLIIDFHGIFSLPHLVISHDGAFRHAVQQPAAPGTRHHHAVWT